MSPFSRMGLSDGHDHGYRNKTLLVNAESERLLAAGMARHVRVRLEARLGFMSSTFDNPSESSRREWCAALGREHERRGHSSGSMLSRVAGLTAKPGTVS
jgi:hypothetical protein